MAAIISKLRTRNDSANPEYADKNTGNNTVNNKVTKQKSTKAVKSNDSGKAGYWVLIGAFAMVLVIFAIRKNKSK